MNPEIPLFVYFLYSSAVVVIIAAVYLFYRSAGNQKKQEEHSLRGVSQNYQRMWTGRYQNIPLKFYGGGCDQAFDVYLQGESQVAVKNIGEIADWLLACKYISDPEYKGVRDHWQHPIEFEQTRTGDCEDFALWTWRKLIELNVQCEFMVGKWVHNGRTGTHAWVLFYDDNKPVIFETTGITKDRMFKPLESVAAEYIPFASIDNKVQKKVYVGIAKWLMMLANKK